ncbi:hypothetical protein PR001_g28288 [Phytophthora rubi]|uniref:Secreted protein n=1 Tax=Phytophthora rubi TaxID=129364 RepID=A0A6A3HAB9_9STRA|nr:hypothetical protein PR001_g28288 [Phytophthora rubi]
MYSATLFVIARLPRAVAAAHLTCASSSTVFCSSSTLPLPPGPVLPRDPPSKNPILLTSRSCPCGWSDPSVFHCAPMNSATCSLVTVLLVTGCNP